MFKSGLSKLLYTIMVAILITVSFGSAADDTEIYFNVGSSNAQLRPNLLFILDTSGSMTATVSGTGKSRIEILREAMTNILTNLQGVNVGLMRFTANEGGAVLFPVTYIDASDKDVVGDAASTNPSFSNRLTDGSNDAVEDLSDNNVTLDDTTLDMTQIANVTGGTYDFQTHIYHHDPTNDAQETVCRSSYWHPCGNGDVNTTGDSLDVVEGTVPAVRFTDITIPQGATINSAYLTFTVKNQGSSNVSASIAVEQIDDAEPITGGYRTQDITGRNYVNSTVYWNNIPNPSANSVVTSPNITSLVNAIISRPGWNAGQSMLFKIEVGRHDGNGDRHFYTADNTQFYPQLRAHLYINYSIPSVTGHTNEVAFRFPNITVPQGSTITKANLVLTAQNSGTTPTSWTVTAEAADDSAPITATSSNISSRAPTSASVTWTPGSWTSGNSYTSPDLSSLIQEVVNRAGFCGGNAVTLMITGTGLRQARSVEQSSGSAPELTYTYQFASSPNGCTAGSTNAQGGSGYDDAEEAVGGSQGGNVSTGSTVLNIQSNNLVGLRFPSVAVPQGATIKSAYIQFTSHDTNSDTTAGTIYGAAEDNFSQFAGTADEISDLITNKATTATVAWDGQQAWTTNTTCFWYSCTTTGNPYDTADLSSIVQEIVNRSGWATGNAMGFMIKASAGTRGAYSYDGNAQDAPRLYVTYEGAAGETYKTVRQRLIEVVQQLPAQDWTPITKVMYEAAHYWDGKSVDYGLTRAGGSDTRVSHPASYCSTDSTGTVSCPGVNTSYTDANGATDAYGTYYPNGCTHYDENSYSCRDMVIKTTGSGPDYVSPFNSDLTCQRNYQVLLTDGAANSSDSTVRTNISNEYLGGNACSTTDSSGYTYSTDELCTVDLVKSLHDNDQSSTLANSQTVNTYTIAFNLNDSGALSFLSDMAKAGTGTSNTGFYTASNASDLASVFNNILTAVKNNPTSITAPSLATNAFNRLLSRNDVYFGLFTPELTKAWFGNVKKYHICVDTTTGCALGDILDANGNEAVDPTTNKFKTTARSVWSSAVDGQATTRGGAGAQMTDYNNRVIYTDTTSTGTAPTSGTALNATDASGDYEYMIDSTDWNNTPLSDVRSLVCPTPSTSTGSDCETRMLWMLGKIDTADPDNDASSTTRWTVNDVLHSSPGIITYGGADTNGDGIVDTFYDKLLVGTNDGGLRFINGTTGLEEWTFLPQSMLNNQSQLFTNAEGTHIYGMDLTPTIQVVDKNNDGVIDPSAGDFVHVFAGMRRGGDLIYALNLTPGTKVTSTSAQIVPKFMWRIQGGSGDFTRLAQTWSQPRLATLRLDDNGTSIVKTVLIFGGGYDSSLDSGFGTAPTGGSDNAGNAVYIVDPDNGAKILSISGSSGSDIVVPAMKYSVPGKITVLDSNGDGIDDRLYFTDTGGQVWRVDLGDNIELDGTSHGADPGSTVVGRLAAISDTSNAADERRFFEAPSVVQVLDTKYSSAAGGAYDYVLVGTGNRAHPLNTTVDNRFYAFRDTTVSTMADSDGNHLADSYPQQVSGVTTPIGNSDLVDVTSQVLDSSSATDRSSLGWYYDFNSAGSTGEKVLSAPLTLAGTVFFSSYLPDATNSTDLCDTQIGGGDAYNFNILNAKAALDWDLSGTVDPIKDRVKSLGGGIPSDVVPVFTNQGIVGIVGIEGGAAQLGTLSGLPRYRTYWYKETPQS